MDYTIWYQEHLLKLEDVLGKTLERRMRRLMAEKLQQMMEKGAPSASLTTGQDDTGDDG